MATLPSRRIAARPLLFLAAYTMLGCATGATRRPGPAPRGVWGAEASPAPMRPPQSGAGRGSRRTCGPPHIPVGDGRHDHVTRVTCGAIIARAGQHMAGDTGAASGRLAGRRRCIRPADEREAAGELGGR